MFYVTRSYKEAAKYEKDTYSDMTLIHDFPRKASLMKRIEVKPEYQIGSNGANASQCFEIFFVSKCSHTVTNLSIF